MQLIAHLVYSAVLAERFSDSGASKSLLRSALRCGKERLMGRTSASCYFLISAPHLIATRLPPCSPGCQPWPKQS